MDGKDTMELLRGAREGVETGQRHRGVKERIGREEESSSLKEMSEMGARGKQDIRRRETALKAIHPPCSSLLRISSAR